MKPITTRTKPIRRRRGVDQAGRQASRYLSRAVDHTLTEHQIEDDPADKQAAAYRQYLRDFPLNDPRD